ncbi:MAG: hypothetical protein ACOYZ6_14595 [Chloroflexota bacterium]
MKIKTAILLLAIILTACTPAMVPTSTVFPFTATATATFAIPIPSPAPTQSPIPFITPDATQVARWKEYQTALAKVVIAGYSPIHGYSPDLYKNALCEWDILGRSDRKVHVWAYCAPWGREGGESPAIINLEQNGTVKNIETPFGDSKWKYRIREMFPVEAQERIGLYTGRSVFDGRLKEMIDHIHYRESHPDVPPLIVLLATPTKTPPP